MYNFSFSHPLPPSLLPVKTFRKKKIVIDFIIFAYKISLLNVDVTQSH